MVPSEQVYTALAGGDVRFLDDDFEADLKLDPDGYVISYPGLAKRAGTEVRR